MIRSFVLIPWAYYKELKNAVVEPMPFRGMDMSLFPDSLGEYPEELKKYIEEWNTRVHPETEVIVQDKGLLESVTHFFKHMFNRIRDFWQSLFASDFTAGNKPTESFFVSGAASIESKGQLHYSLNTNYLELEIESTIETVTDGYCSNCHAVHGSSGVPKQLKSSVFETCFGSGTGCHTNAENSAIGSMSAVNFSGAAGPLSRHSSPIPSRIVLSMSVHSPVLFFMHGTVKNMSL